MFNILVVEDDPHSRKLMEAILVRYGYKPIPACDGAEALQLMEHHHIDLVVLDIMMPRIDGYEFTNILRTSGCNVPILMVTARETPADVHRGFLIGTDDYMKKPVDEEEMILRIGALLRRSKIVNEHKLTIGQTTLYYDSLTVSSPSGSLELPQKEFMLLYKLLSYQNKIFTRRQLMDEIWDMDSESDERTVDVHVSRLRDKFKSSNDFEIVTVRGLGYKAVPKR
ncbi:MAG: response regulator transcription factor [Clostridia bacterium]|nr:response regulator transcription factor [Clostridia bacterium]